MPLGAFAPLPLRLGGTPEEGWGAGQHARLCADLAAAKRSTSYAVLTVSITGETAGTVTAYSGRNGVGVAAGPAVTVSGHVATLTWPATHEDPYEVVHALNIIATDVGAHGSTELRATARATSPRVVEVRIRTAAGALTTGSATLEVWSHQPASFADYGGDPNKRNSATEGEQPYAWGWYRELLSQQGSAYTSDRASYVHAENLATARLWSSVFSRTPERLVANSLPGTADERLGYWVEVLRVRVRDGERGWQIREKAAAKYRISVGNDRVSVDEAISGLLGSTFVAAHRSEGANIGDPPETTFWHGGTAGPASHDLGGGPWMSHRAHVGVEVEKPADVEVGDFLEVMDVQLSDLLDAIVPAWVTWDWATSDGFLLDVSQLDFDGLGN